MKILLALLFFSTSLLSQNDSVYIKKSVDEMEDRNYFFPSRELVLNTKDKRKGVVISAFIDEEDDGVAIYELSAKMYNIGTCVENNELIFMFQDSSKITLISWNDWNCDGNAWFKLLSTDIQKLSTSRIIKMQIKNGYTFERFTSSIPKQDYFIQLFYAVRTKKIKRVK